MYTRHVYYINYMYIIYSLFAGTELAVFGNIVRQLLGDAQKRIVFRAQVSNVLDVLMIPQSQRCFRNTHNNTKEGK